MSHVDLHKALVEELMTGDDVRHAQKGEKESVDYNLDGAFNIFREKIPDERDCWGIAKEYCICE